MSSHPTVIIVFGLLSKVSDGGPVPVSLRTLDGNSDSSLFLLNDRPVPDTEFRL